MKRYSWSIGLRCESQQNCYPNPPLLGGGEETDGKRARKTKKLSVVLHEGNEKDEVIEMAVMELLPQLRQLSRADKLYVMQVLVSELAAEQTNLLKPNLNYPVWSPYDAFQAANTMLQVLKAAGPLSFEVRPKQVSS